MPRCRQTPLRADKRGQTVRFTVAIEAPVYRGMSIRKTPGRAGGIFCLNVGRGSGGEKQKTERNKKRKRERKKDKGKEVPK